jgi:hypothetical protein
MRTRRSCCAVMWLGHCKNLLILALIRESFILCLYAYMEFRLDNCFVQEGLDLSALSQVLGVSLFEASSCSFGCRVQSLLSLSATRTVSGVVQQHGSLHSSNLQGTQSGRPTIRWSCHSTMSARRCAARPLAGPILEALHGLRMDHMRITSSFLDPDPGDQRRARESTLSPTGKGMCRLLTRFGTSLVLPSL